MNGDVHFVRAGADEVIEDTGQIQGQAIGGERSEEAAPERIEQFVEAAPFERLAPADRSGAHAGGRAIEEESAQIGLGPGAVPGGVGPVVAERARLRAPARRLDADAVDHHHKKCLDKSQTIPTIAATIRIATPTWLLDV